MPRSRASYVTSRNVAALRAARGIELQGPDRRVQLDASGRLDPAWHAAPVTLSFVEVDSGRHTAIEYGLLGTVRSADVTP